MPHKLVSIYSLAYSVSFILMRFVRKGRREFKLLTVSKTVFAFLRFALYIIGFWV